MDGDATRTHPTDVFAWWVLGETPSQRRRLDNQRDSGEPRNRDAAAVDDPQACVETREHLELNGGEDFVSRREGL